MAATRYLILRSTKVGGSYHRIFVKLRWAKGNDQIWVVYENSRVAAKWMQAMSDPYPISDFPEFKVAELN